MKIFYYDNLEPYGMLKQRLPVRVNGKVVHITKH